MENFSFVVSAFPLENNCTVKLPAKSSNDGYDRDGGEREGVDFITLSHSEEREYWASPFPLFLQSSFLPLLKHKPLMHMHLLLWYQTDNILKGLWFTAVILASQLSPTIIVCIYLPACKIPTCPYKWCDCITLYFLCCSNCSLEQTPQSVHLNMLGLLGLSRSFSFFLHFRNFSFFSLATPLFSCYSISPCIFPLIFCKCPNVPVWFIYVWQCFRVLSSFPLGTFCVNLSSFGCLSPPALVSYSAPPVHSFPPFSWICLLWCYLFPPLVRSLLLYFSPSIFFPPSFMFLLPLRFFLLWNCYDPEGWLFLPCSAKETHPSAVHIPIPLLFCFALPFFLALFFSVFFLCLQPLPVAMF